MTEPKITISIETHAKTETKVFGRNFIQALCREDRRLVPEFVSEDETFTDPFTDGESFVQKGWARPRQQIDERGTVFGTAFEGPMWKRKSRLASQGMVMHGLTNVRGEHSPSQLWFESEWSIDVDFSHLFDAWVTLADPTIAMLHVFTHSEMSTVENQQQRRFRLGMFGSPKTGVPNIGWAMAFGGDYANEIDINRIKHAGFPVSEQNGCFVIRVSEQLSDVVDRFTAFSRRRAELKQLFRPGFIWVTAERSGQL